MNKEFDNLLAFLTGDLFATVGLVILDVQFIATAESLAVKLLLVILSGFVGGFFGLIGKYVAQRYLIDKYFKVILVCCLLAAMVQGCAPRVAGVTTNATTTTSDSTSVQVIERFVPVYIAGDTVVFEKLIECPEWDLPKADGSTSLTMTKTPKPFKQVVKGKRSDGVIELDDYGKLTAIFNCNQWRDSVKVKDTEIARLKSTFKSELRTETIHVPYIPKIYVWAMWFSCIVIILFIGKYALRFTRNYFKISIPFLSWLIK